MRIHFRRTGGLAGTSLEATVNTESLAASDAERVETLVADARFFDLPEILDAGTGTPDAFAYEITVEGEGRTHTVTTSDVAAPPSLVPLLDWLGRTARSGRRPAP